MPMDLGIDTGGTYTDAVIVDRASGRILAGAKALTTHYDLSIGIGRAVQEVVAKVNASGSMQTLLPADISLVGLSTTLATNAIVEGKGCPVCLLLIGYDPALLRRYGFEKDLVTKDVVHLRGGHDGHGNEVAPLDEKAAREAILARHNKVDAFAVSGYFGVRNPAHELKVQALIEELTVQEERHNGFSAPVTCGHELTTHLDAVRRATTAALNARLIPLLRDLISTVHHTLDRMGIRAPLMIVKGDGSLVKADRAMRRPIDTILSGPAASVVGAWHLAGRRDAWIVDIGGTTTDIAELCNGRPRLSVEGAHVGGWRTMVETTDVHTTGLGGDSSVRISDDDRGFGGGIHIGPDRVIPLCLLSSQYRGVIEELRRQAEIPKEKRKTEGGQFVLARRRTRSTVSRQDRDLVRECEARPVSLLSLMERDPYGLITIRRIRELEGQGVVLKAGFTPTDALHVLGRFERWDKEASLLGAGLLASRIHLEPGAFCEKVTLGVSRRLAMELVSKVLCDEVKLPDWDREPSAFALLERAVGAKPKSGLACHLTLSKPIVAVGAPVAAYVPETAKQLHTELIIPQHADVANAIGAVVGSVVLRIRVLIHYNTSENSYRMHLPEGVRDFPTLEECINCAEKAIPDRLAAMAKEAGADQVDVEISRADCIAPIMGPDGEHQMAVESELTFSAVGRPNPTGGRINSDV